MPLVIMVICNIIVATFLYIQLINESKKNELKELENDPDHCKTIPLR